MTNFFSSLPVFFLLCRYTSEVKVWFNHILNEVALTFSLWLERDLKPKGFLEPFDRTIQTTENMLKYDILLHWMD